MKNLLKNVVRSFKNNKISLIGLIFLLFFGLGSFCVMSNTISNISNQYTSLAKQGNLHDFTASELYEIGNAAYVTNTGSNGFVYKIEGETPQDPQRKDPFTNISVTDLYSNAEPKKEGTYYYIVPHQVKTGGETIFSTRTYTRTYSLKLDEEKSTGLYKKFAHAGSTDCEFEIKVNEVVERGEQPSDVATAVEELEKDWSVDNMKALIAANALQADYNLFLKGISDRTNYIYSIITSKNSPLSQELTKNYPKEVEFRQFKSINVTATKDNIFYKVIDSNPTDTIDKLILFKDPNGNYGNNLFDVNDWAPYNSQMKFYAISGEEVPLGTQFEDKFIVPNSFEEMIQQPLIEHSTIISQEWSTDERYVYSQMVHNRFKRIYSGTLSSDTHTAFEETLKTLAAINMDTNTYYLNFVNEESDIAEAYGDYMDYQTSWAENVIISMNGNIVINWLTPTPMTCTMENWTKQFAVVNPQHLQNNKKHVIDSKWFNDFQPFKEWYRINFGSYPTGVISQQIAIDWINTLSNNQFKFWHRPSTFTTVNEMLYTVYKKDGTGATTIKVVKGTEPGQWNGVGEDSMVSCGDNHLIVWGCGLSPDFMYPVVDVTRPTPNLKTECLTYVNDAGYKAIKLAFFNSPVEDFLVAKFMPSVTTTRQHEIIDELNKFCADNMLYPKDVKAVYLANDTNNILNSSAFRVSYIPNLVSVIRLITVILCTFLAILALVICLIIIKRYVENNRVNIGIMRANGISKMKIALSLMPFAFVPALIGGIAAYLLGLFLQIPMLKLFGNYWTLPTAILGFDWVSMLVCIFLPFILFGIVTIIATLLVLRSKTVDLMKAGSEFKTNSFSKIAKKPFRHFGVLTRFRVALAFNSLSRLIVLALMSCLTMTSLVFAMTSFGKLNRSQVINSSQFDYSFNLQLTTPTTVGGNYNLEDWSKMEDPLTYAGYGYENPDEYIYNVSWDTSEPGKTNPWQYLTKWYSDSAIYLHSIANPEYKNNIGNNGNLMLPTMADATGQKQDLQYLKNKTCSKLTLDYVVGLGSISSNPWEIALALMPANSRNLASDAYNTIIQKVGAYIDEGKEPWTDYAKFFTKDAEGKLAKPYSLLVDYKSWLSGFSDDYVKFLIDIYKTPEFMMDEYRISYGIVPINWFKENDNAKDDELYTYITGTFKELSSKQRAGFDSNHEITIEGIKRDSKFIKLTDASGKDLNKVLYSSDDQEDFNWVIINAYAAHKYNLGVGSTFSINMTNMADRYDRQLHPEEFEKSGAKSSVAKFKVLAISQGTNGEAFYCKQKPANQLLGLPDGDSWNSTHKYMMWQESAGADQKIIDLAANEGSKYTVYAVNESGVVKPEETKVDRFNKSIPTGFNGIYTENKYGKPLTQGLSLYSYSGLYPGSSVFTADAMKNLLKQGNNLALANFMTGINDPKYYGTGASIEDFVEKLRATYGDTTMVTCICGATDVAASDLIYQNLISTFNLAETTIMSVIIPITIIVVGIISNLIINDSKKMAAMLKALGYSDRKNAMSILALFVPTIVLGLALAIPASMGICIGYQSLIFGSANILIDVSRKWWYYLASVGGIGIILVATYVVGWISLKKDRLVDQIKN